MPRPELDRMPGGILSHQTVDIFDGSFVDLSPMLSANYPVSFQWFESVDGVNFDPMPGRITSNFFVSEVETTTSLPDDASDWLLIPGGTVVRDHPRFIVLDPNEPSRFWRLKKE